MADIEPALPPPPDAYLEIEPALPPPPDAYLQIEPALPPPPAGDMEEKKKTQIAVRKAAATTVFLSAAGIAGYLSGGLRIYTNTESFSVITLFGIFSFGLATLFMSFP